LKINILPKILKNIFKNNQGVVLIETAVVLPVLILIIFGGIELGIYFFKQHIVARAVDSVIIPLQLNPSDPRREIETQIRNSGMGIVDFSVGNTQGNYVCARAYSDFATAQKNRCSAANPFDNGWHPEAGFWVMNPMKPYYVVVVAHVKYRSLIGLKGILPDIQEWHVFQVSPIAIVQPTTKAPTQAVVEAPAPSSDNAPMFLGNNNNNNNNSNGNNNDNNNNADINQTMKQFQNILSKMPMFQNR